MTVIYADILLVINLTVDYLLLFGTARLGGAKFERLKGLFGALIGAFYSLIIIFDLSRTVMMISKLAVSAVMVLITFGKRKIGEFIRLVLIFYICGFLFSGFMMLINSFAQADSFFIKGGIVYFELSAMEIVASGTAAFLVTEILRRIFRRGEPEGKFIAKIYNNGMSAVLKGFTDTGNMLCDPFTGRPVAVAYPESIKKILPLGESLSTENLFRYIPAKTVSGTVLMRAFVPDKVIIENEKGTFEAEDIMIALSENVPENTLIIGKNAILKEKGKVFTEV